MSEDHDALSNDLPKPKELAVPPIPEYMRLISNAINTTQSQQSSWLIASQKIPSYVAPWMDAARSIGETLKGATLWVNEHRNEINLALRTAQQFRESMNTTVLPIIKQFNDGLSSVAPIIEAGLKAYKARLESYPHLSQHFELLAKHGWFLSMYFGLSEIDAIASSAGQNIELLEQMVAQEYRTSIEEHTSQILNEYPHREFAIRPAVEAHLRKEYALSVPIFFAQADGICAETVGKHIFTGKPGGDGHISSLAKDEVNRLNLENEASGANLLNLLEIALWSPLVEQQPIAYNENRREEAEYSGLNRHSVLHGESLDYATETNSLKAFSLLSHVSSLLAKKRDAVESD